MCIKSFGGNYKAGASRHTDPVECRLSMHPADSMVLNYILGIIHCMITYTCRVLAYLLHGIRNLTHSAPCPGSLLEIYRGHKLLPAI